MFGDYGTSPPGYLALGFDKRAKSAWKLRPQPSLKLNIAPGQCIFIMATAQEHNLIAKSLHVVPHLTAASRSGTDVAEGVGISAKAVEA